MTSDQSRHLKVGDRVCWRATTNDLGTVVRTSWNEVSELVLRFVPGDAGHPRVVKTRIGCPAYAGLSGCLLGRCLLKTLICRVRVRNHVPCRRVALRASRAARRGAGADVIWVCGLQRRHVDAAFAKFLFQSLCFLFQSLCLPARTYRP